MRLTWNEGIYVLLIAQPYWPCLITDGGLICIWGCINFKINRNKLSWVFFSTGRLIKIFIHFGGELLVSVKRDCIKCCFPPARCFYSMEKVVYLCTIWIEIAIDVCMRWSLNASAMSLQGRKAQVGPVFRIYFIERT